MSGVLLALLTAAAAPPAEPYFPPSFAAPAFTCDFHDAKSPPLAIVDQWEDRWFSRQLRAAGEPSLYKASLRPRGEAEESLRLTWLRTFHHPMVVRVEMAGGKARLLAKELSGRGGYDPGEVMRTIDRALSAAELAGLRTLLAGAHAFESNGPSCDMVLDGSVWLLESADERGYHFADRRSPDEGEVRAIGLYLLGLTRWTLEPVY